MRTYIPKVLERMFHEEPALKRAFLVGGCVRDWLCSMPIKDIDIEVFDIGYADLVRALSRWGRADLVGKSFGVVKLVLDGEILDFSLPRRDSKIGAGHKGFDVVVDPTLTLLEASSRRDFTINSMSWDPRTDQVIDLHGGQSDLNHRILRHTSSAFIEDPLRVLRGMQFASRLNLIPAQETVELCRRIRDSYHELPKDRIREEWLTRHSWDPA